MDEKEIEKVNNDETLKLKEEIEKLKEKQSLLEKEKEELKVKVDKSECEPIKKKTLDDILKCFKGE